jgi:hypothetical protein
MHIWRKDGTERRYSKAGRYVDQAKRRRGARCPTVPRDGGASSATRPARRTQHSRYDSFGWRGTRGEREEKGTLVFDDVDVPDTRHSRDPEDRGARVLAGPALSEAPDTLGRTLSPTRTSARARPRHGVPLKVPSRTNRCVVEEVGRGDVGVKVFPPV